MAAEGGERRLDFFTVALFEEAPPKCIGAVRRGPNRSHFAPGNQLMLLAVDGKLEFGCPQLPPEPIAKESRRFPNEVLGLHFKNAPEDQCHQARSSGAGRPFRQADVYVAICSSFLKRVILRHAPAANQPAERAVAAIIPYGPRRALSAMFFPW